MSTSIQGLRNAADFMRQASGVDPVWLREAADEMERLREFVGWIDTWISNPARAYSHDALEGLFGMTRDKISALTSAYRGKDE